MCVLLFMRIHKLYSKFHSFLKNCTCNLWQNKIFFQKKTLIVDNLIRDKKIEFVQKHDRYV